LVQFWATFDLEESSEVNLRLRSAPWDDIIDEDQQEDILAVSDDDVESLLDSPQVNILKRPPPPTWYQSVVVPSARETAQLPDPQAQQDWQRGVQFPPPKDGPPVFLSTPSTPLMDEVIADLLQGSIIEALPHIVNAFRVFLVAKADGSARPVYDLSPWTPFYSTPPIRLYSTAEVLQTIPQNA
jgi:hypothetical protein